MPLRVAHQRCSHFDRAARDPFDRRGALAQQPIDGGADGAKAQQAYRDRWHDCAR